MHSTKIIAMFLLAIFNLLPLCFGSTSTATCFGSDTSLMLHLNGTDGDTTFTDSSANGFSPTVNGDAQLDTAQQQFGTASLLLDGTGDYLQYSDNTAWDLGANDFTIDFWVRFNVVVGSVFMGQRRVAISEGWAFRFITPANVVRFNYSTDGTTVSSIDNSWSPSSGVWYHVTGVRSGSNFYAFIDGTQIGTTQTLSGTIFNSTDSFLIGAFDSVSPIQPFNGWMDEIRIIKGTAIWTSNFTAPSAEYTQCPERRRVLATVCS